MRTVPPELQTVEFQTPMGQSLFVRPERVDGVAEAPSPNGPATWLYLAGGPVIVAGAVQTVRAALKLDCLPPLIQRSTELERLRIEKAAADLELARVKLAAASEIGRRGRRRTGTGEG